MTRFIKALVATLFIVVCLVYCNQSNAAGIYTVGAANLDLTESPATNNLAVGYVMGIIQAEFMSDPLVCKSNFASIDAFAAESRMLANTILSKLSEPTEEQNKSQALMYVIRAVMRQAYPCK